MSNFLDTAKSILVEKFSESASLASDAVASGTWSYPLLGIVYFVSHPSLYKAVTPVIVKGTAMALGTTLALFIFTYMPQVAVCAVFSGPLAFLIAALLVLGEASAIVLVISRVFFMSQALDQIFDAVLLQQGNEPLVLRGRDVKSSGGIKKLGKSVAKPLRRFSKEGILRYVITFPLNSIPVIGTVMFFLYNGINAGPKYHVRYFQLKGFDPSARQTFVDKHKGAYTATTFRDLTTVTNYNLEKGVLKAHKNSLKAVIQETSKQAKAEMRGKEARTESERAARDKVLAKEDNTASKKRQATKVFKSAEFIEDSSDELEALPEPKRPTTTSPKKKRSPKKDIVKFEQPARNIVESDDESASQEPSTVSLKKPSPKKDGAKSKESAAKFPPPRRQNIADSDDESEIPAKPTSKRKAVGAEDGDTASFGDSPKPKKKARSSAEKLPTQKSARAKSKGESSDNKHDETIKKLKSFVNACGVRRPWAKIFQDIPKPTQQIAKLKEVLADLGMTGRMSMEQAKRIKAERELASELADVQSFEQSVLECSRNRTASSSGASIRPAESESEELEQDVKQRRRKVPALRSIEAFLGSQSDDD
ncbi:hypothetical protein C0991_009814 [Blastosporella zonata]|nr:hypothetical protein C0991_009814 [Blastosporella zonata]